MQGNKIQNKIINKWKKFLDQFIRLFAESFFDTSAYAKASLLPRIKKGIDRRNVYAAVPYTNQLIH